MLDKKSPEEIKILQEGGSLLASILRRLADKAQIGVTGKELNELAEKLIKKAGGSPAFKNYHGFPAALCVSVNQTVVHGIPNDQPFQDGDLVGLDLGMKYRGLYTDTALTVGIGEISQAAKELLTVTQKALEIGVSQVRVGGYVSDIGRAIESFVRPYGYGIVRDLAGHGVGRQVHESPSVPNFSSSGKSDKIFPGLILAIEPMIILGGDWQVKTADNHWDVMAKDGSLTAHFEHSVAATKDGPLILTK